MEETEEYRGKRAVYCLNDLYAYMKEADSRAEKFLDELKKTNGGKVPNAENNMVRSQQMTYEAIRYRLKQSRGQFEHDNAKGSEANATPSNSGE